MFYRLEEVNHLVEVVVEKLQFFLEFSNFAGLLIHFDLYSFSDLWGSKTTKPKVGPKFCIISVYPEAIAEVFSRIDHKFDLMCLGSMGNQLWNLTVVVLVWKWSLNWGHFNHLHGGKSWEGIISTEAHLLFLPGARRVRFGSCPHRNYVVLAIRNNFLLASQNSRSRSTPKSHRRSRPI